MDKMQALKDSLDYAHQGHYQVDKSNYFTDKPYTIKYREAVMKKWPAEAQKQMELIQKIRNADLKKKATKAFNDQMDVLSTKLSKVLQPESDQYKHATRWGTSRRKRKAGKRRKTRRSRA
jgi:uncharacterized membrane protein YgaE (UPF0421/DUF939 family)